MLGPTEHVRSLEDFILCTITVCGMMRHAQGVRDSSQERENKNGMSAWAMVKLLVEDYTPHLCFWIQILFLTPDFSLLLIQNMGYSCDAQILKFPAKFLTLAPAWGCFRHLGSKA